MNRPDLHIVEPAPWNTAAAYKPDCIELLRANARKSPSIFATLAADWREFWNEVADAPAHHAGFALMVFIASCVLIYGSAWVLVHTVLS